MQAVLSTNYSSQGLRIPRLHTYNVTKFDVSMNGAALYVESRNELLTVGHPSTLARDPLLDPRIYRSANLSGLDSSSLFEGLSYVRISYQRALMLFFENGDFYRSSETPAHPFDADEPYPILRNSTADFILKTDPLSIHPNATIIDFVCDSVCAIVASDLWNHSPDVFGEVPFWVFTWGSNTELSLGRSTNQAYHPYRLRAGDIPSNVSLTEVTISQYAGGMVLGNDGRVYAWGGYNFSTYFYATTSPIWMRVLPSVSMIPSRCPNTGFALAETELCYGKLYANPLVCSGNGICTGLNRCVCHDGWLTFECSVPRTCFDVDFNLLSSVCSTHGECVDLDDCLCQTGWDGPECEETVCFGEFGEAACGGKERGKCSATPNVCTCYDGGGDRIRLLRSPKYSGHACSEMIAEGTLLHSGKEIRISYVVEFESLATADGRFLLQSGFDCGLILTSSTLRILGGTSSLQCLFVADSTVKTAFLQITMHQALRGDNATSLILDVTPATNRTRVVSVGVKEEEFISTPSSSDVVALGIGLGFSVFFVGVIIVLIGIVVGCVVWNRREQKRADRFRDLADIDILLAEQKATPLLNDDEYEFDMSLFDLDFDAITLEHSIGSGGSGSIVYRGNWNKIRVAFKVFTFDRMAALDREAVEAEIVTLRGLNHHRIVRLVGAAIRSPRIGIVLEYCPYGDLKAFLRSQVQLGEVCDLSVRVSMLRDISSAMCFVHAKGIIHRDLKSSNVLVAEDLSIRLMDFGLSRVLKTGDVSKTMGIGTSSYMAPELVLGQDYGLPIDVFSYGLVLFEVVSLNFAPYGIVDEFVAFRVANDATYRPDVSQIDNEDLRSMMEACWSANPSDRPTFQDLAARLENWKKPEETEH